MNNSIKNIGNQETLTKTGVLARKYWNKRLLNTLLPEADEVIYRANKTIHSYLYLLSKVNEAEKSPIFQARIDEVEKYELAREERRYEIEESLKMAMRMDFKEMSIPKSGGLESAISICLSMMKNYKNLIRFLSDEDKSLFGWGGMPKELDPKYYLLPMIAAKRLDLAFQCGQEYMYLTYNYPSRRDTEVTPLELEYDLVDEELIP